MGKEILFKNPNQGALYAYRLGLKNIFPVKQCGTVQKGAVVDKTPLVSEWQDFPNRIKNETALINHCTTNAGCNWGYVPKDEPYFVLDIDAKNNKNGFETLKQLEATQGDLPETLTTQTPSKGQHRFFKIKEGVKITGGTNKLGAGLDIQAGKKYVVLFGSRIEDGITVDGKKQIGGCYEIIDDSPIAYAPDWLIEKIQTKHTTEGMVEGKIETPKLDPEEIDTPQNIDSAISYLQTAPICTQDAIEGFSGEGLYNIFCEVRDRGISLDTTRDLVLKHYNHRCEPAWDMESSEDRNHFEAKLKNVYAYAQNSNIGALTPAADFKRTETAYADMIQEGKGPKHISDFKGEAPKREWLIPDWLPKGEISSLYGKGGSGKSLMALQMALSITTGMPFMQIEIENKMPTLCVFCEDTDEELHRRKNAIVSDFIDKKTLKNTPLYLWSRVGENNDLAKINKDGNDVIEGSFLKVLEKVIENIPGEDKLLVLDTLSDVYLGGENIREQVNKFIKTHLGSLVKKHNLTVLLLGHPSKNVQQGGYSGSTAWENAVRNRLSLDRHKDFEDIMVLKREKSNYAKTGEEIFLKWEKGIFNMTDISKVVEEDLTMEDQSILDCIINRMQDHDQRTLNTVAKEMMTDTRFAGMAVTTLERRVIKILTTPRQEGAFVYEYAEKEILGERGKRWVFKVSKGETNDETSPSEDEVSLFQKGG